MTRARPPRGPADPARQVAFDVLRAVTADDAYANLLLPRLLRERGVSGRDAALATELAFGTLRGRATYDAVVARCIDRDIDAVDAEVLDLLRLGSHQLLATRVPSHAAVATTVDLARTNVGPGRAGFVNAVLRRVASQTRDEWLAEVADLDDPLDALAVRHSHPRWVVSAFRDALGGDLAETEALLVADNTPAQVTLVARPGRCELDELVAAGATPGRWSPWSARLPSGDPARIPAVRQGRAGVQDEGSQLVAIAAATVPVTGADTRWLDLCAGPGGKAALLAGLGRDRGARVTAVELQPHRAELVRAAVEDTADVVVADGTDPRLGTGDFDRVLVDAPCTGLGALRRRPDSRWRRSAADVGRLGRLQRDLLDNGVAAVRPGGVVAYVTCSPHLAETAAVVADVLRRRTDVELVDARPFLPGVPQLGDGPTVQLWPHRHDTDAMFLALIRRTSPPG
ncbi:MAG TPA: transcription antitermination factor NusB [Actinomycetes bacterium]|nr:transcription antitermination factor NusB [Actinomycetes bacterium]